MARWALASFEQVQVLDLTLTNPALKGFIAGFHDGTYGYAVPYYNGAHFGKVAFWALASFGQVQLLDLTLMDPALKGFNGGFSDGTYSYAVPHHNGAWFGMVARWALASFEQAKALDLTLTDPARKGLPRRLQRWHLRIRYATFNNGAYFDKVTRWSLASFGCVQVLDLAATDPVLTGFGGGFSDGTYDYAVPYYNGFGKVWSFQGGFSDGTYGYAMPFNNGPVRQGGALGPGLLRTGTGARPDADGPSPEGLRRRLQLWHLPHGHRCNKFSTTYFSLCPWCTSLHLARFTVHGLNAACRI